MANYFDQFDASKPSAAAKSGGNFFDQFDAPISQQKSDFLSRVSGDILKRANEGADAIVSYNAGDQGMGQTGLQLVGKMGAGTIGDVAGETVKSAYQSLPDSTQRFIGNKASQAADYIADTDIGKAGIEGSKQLGEAYQGFAKNNPNAARSLESATNIGALIPAGKAVETVAQPVSKAGEVVGNTGKAALDAVTPTEIQSASNLRNLSSQAYRAAGAEGGLLTPDMSNSFLGKVNQILPQEERVKAMVGDSPATKIIDNLQSWKDTPITFDEADQLDKLLTKKMKAGSAVDSLTGKLTDEGNDLLDIQHALRDTMDSGGTGFDKLDDARKLWSSSMRQKQLENIVERAHMTDNPQTAIRTGFKNLASNPSRLRGFSDEEITAIKQAGKTGLLTGALKFAGSRLISSVAGATGGAAGGGFLGAAAGAAAGGLIGTPFRMGADALQTAKANKVMRLISKREAVKDALKTTKP